MCTTEYSIQISAEEPNDSCLHNKKFTWVHYDPWTKCSAGMDAMLENIMSKIHLDWMNTNGNCRCCLDIPQARCARYESTSIIKRLDGTFKWKIILKHIFDQIVSWVVLLCFQEKFDGTLKENYPPLLPQPPRWVKKAFVYMKNEWNENEQIKKRIWFFSFYKVPLSLVKNIFSGKK